MKSLAAICAAALAIGAGPARALDFELPGQAALTGQADAGTGEHVVAVGPWEGGRVDTIAVTGHLTRQAWRIGNSAVGTRQLTELLAGQLEQAGYETLFRCDQDLCGGFDFRFATMGLSEPQMHVDLGDYHYVSARRTGDGADFITLLVSRSPGAGFVEITQITPAGQAETPDNGVTVTSTKTDPDGAVTRPAGTPVAEQLDTQGYAVLSDLVFETGSSALGPGTFDTLAQLAAYLAEYPDRRVALVGHTDAEGSLENNIALSRRRAASVRTRLIEAYGVSAAQIEAQGVGYLSPIAPNRTEEGRTKNRRVEVVLTTTR